jgi:hypothetical protein
MDGGESSARDCTASRVQLEQLEDDGRLAWFHLRLTRNEIASLLWSASVEGLVESPGGEPKNPADVLAHPDWTWKCTESAKEDRRYVSHQRGAGASDMLKHVQPRFSSAKGIGVAAAGVIAAVVPLLFPSKDDLADKEKPLLAITGVLVALAVLAVLVAHGALREEKVLHRMLDAWPRGRDYRPKRNQFEQMRVRSATAWVSPPIVAALALAAGVWLWHEREQISTEVRIRFAQAALFWRPVIWP